jgi:hypothetical protein
MPISPGPEPGFYTAFWLALFVVVVIAVMVWVGWHY